MLQFVCDVVKDTGKEEYLRLLFTLDWIEDNLTQALCLRCVRCVKHDFACNAHDALKFYTGISTLQWALLPEIKRWNEWNVACVAFG